MNSKAEVFGVNFLNILRPIRDDYIDHLNVTPGGYLQLEDVLFGIGGNNTWKGANGGIKQEIIRITWNP